MAATAKTPKSCKSTLEVKSLEGWDFLTVYISPLKRDLGGGFKYLLFSPLFGEDSHFD